MPVLLVFVQPDLGTALVYLAALGADALRGGSAVAPPRRARLCRRAARSAFSGASPSAASTCSSYQQQRSVLRIRRRVPLPPVTTSMIEDDDRVRPVRGRGTNNSTQVKFGFLPESGTDFIFARFAEQRGFIGP